MGGPADRAVLVRAFEAGRAAGDVEAMAAAALGLAGQHHFGTQVGRTPAYLHEAYRLASGSLRVRLAAALARTWVYGSEPARAVPFAAEAVAEAERLADPALLAEALDADLLVHWGPDDLADRLRITARLEDTVAHLPDVEARLSAHLWRLTTALESLDPVGGATAAAGPGRAGRGVRLGAGAVVRGVAAGHAALIAGDLEAVRDADAPRPSGPVQRGRRAGHPGAAARAERARSLCRVPTTRELAAQAAAFEEFGTAQGVGRSAAEGALAVAGRRSSGPRPGAAGPAAGRLGAVPRDVDWLLTVCVLTEVAAGTGAREVAAEAVDLLAPYAGRGVVNAGGVTFVGVVDDYLRWRAPRWALPTRQTSGRPERAAGYQRMGATWWLRRLADAP